MELANELVALVLQGTKRATAGSLAQYEAEGDAVPQVGDFEIALDGTMRPRAVLRFSEVRVGPLSSVDDQFAHDEGEGDRSRRYWLNAHTTYFQRVLPTLGIEFDPDMATIFQPFRHPLPRALTRTRARQWGVSENPHQHRLQSINEQNTPSLNSWN